MLFHYTTVTRLGWREGQNQDYQHCAPRISQIPSTFHYHRSQYMTTILPMRPLYSPKTRLHTTIQTYLLIV
jgi:hypothetical protein